MQYRVFTNSFITREKLEKEELIKMYLNDEKIIQTEDTFEFDSDSLEEATRKFERLIRKPRYDCYYKGYQYVIVILTDEIEELEIETMGFEYDNEFNEMLDFDPQEYTNEELENALKWYEKNSDKLVGNYDFEIEGLKEILGV